MWIFFYNITLGHLMQQLWFTDKMHTMESCLSSPFDCWPLCITGKIRASSPIKANIMNTDALKPEFYIISFLL